MNMWIAMLSQIMALHIESPLILNMNRMWIERYINVINSAEKQWIQKKIHQARKCFS